jgi:hypothetical protein
MVIPPAWYWIDGCYPNRLKKNQRACLIGPDHLRLASASLAVCAVCAAAAPKRALEVEDFDCLAAVDGVVCSRDGEKLLTPYPFFHAERIKTPTLFLGGDKDFNVPVTGGEQMYEVRSISRSSGAVRFRRGHACAGPAK